MGDDVEAGTGARLALTVRRCPPRIGRLVPALPRTARYYAGFLAGVSSFELSGINLVVVRP